MPEIIAISMTGSPAMTRAAAVADLSSTICPCGARKKRGTSFCRPHYFRLPPGMRNDLYVLIGDGYEAVYAEALDYLNLGSPATVSEGGRYKLVYHDLDTLRVGDQFAIIGESPRTWYPLRTLAPGETFKTGLIYRRPVQQPE